MADGVDSNGLARADETKLQNPSGGLLKRIRALLEARQN